MDPNNVPQPYQPVPNPTPSGGSFNPGQYDFITAPPPKAKKSFLPGPGSSKKQRIMIVAIGVIVLLIFFIILYGILTGGTKSNTEQLITVMQKQTELVRVSGLGNQQAGGTTAKSVAKSTEHVITSQSNQLQSALKARKIKFSTKQLMAGANAQTDKDLKNAAANGRFDDAFIQSIRNQLTEYRTTVKTAYTGSNSKEIKELLNQYYKDVNLLLEQITGEPQT